jgi:hypothetical protein
LKPEMDLNDARRLAGWKLWQKDENQNEEETFFSFSIF